MFFLEKIIAGDLRTESARRKIIDTFIREIVIYDDKIEISYNYKIELPTLPNTEEVESSRIDSMVEIKQLKTNIFFYKNFFKVDTSLFYLHQ